MIKGCDISSNNISYSGAIASSDFVVVKATEGRSYMSPLFKKQADAVKAAGKLLGLYHYARPELGNTPEGEAANFYNQVEPYLGCAILALDYEGAAHKVGAEWAARFIQEVKRLSGVLPLFYTSEAYLKLYKDVAATGCGLWVAKYSTKKPTTGAWPFWAIWQYSSSPYDKDKFNGDSAAWAKYAARG